VIFAKQTAQRNQILQRAIYSNSDRSLFEYSGPLQALSSLTTLY